MQHSMFSPEEHPAKPIASQVSARDWMTRVATSCSPLLQLLGDIGPRGWRGKTSPESFQTIRDDHLQRYWDSSPGNESRSHQADGELRDLSRASVALTVSHGECLTLNMSESTGLDGLFLNDDGVCSLSDILETGDVPQRYFLSAKACRGILRRAVGRGKSLPAQFVSSAARRGGVGEGERGGLIPVAFGGNNTSGPIDVSTYVNAHGGPVGRLDFESETFIVHPAEVAPTILAGRNSSGGDRQPGMDVDTCTSLVPVAFKSAHYTRGKDGAPRDVAFSLMADADKGDKDQLVCAPIADPLTRGGDTSGRRQEDDYNLIGEAVAFQPRFARNDRGAPQEGVAYPLTAEAGRTGKGDSAQCVQYGWRVRRLMPIECERLQGAPDGYTDVPWRGKPASDGQRYRVLGNGQSANVMRWLGTRIKMVSEIE